MIEEILGRMDRRWSYLTLLCWASEAAAAALTRGKRVERAQITAMRLLIGDRPSLEDIDRLYAFVLRQVGRGLMNREFAYRVLRTIRGLERRASGANLLDRVGIVVGEYIGLISWAYDAMNEGMRRGLISRDSVREIADRGEGFLELWREVSEE